MPRGAPSELAQTHRFRYPDSEMLEEEKPEPELPKICPQCKEFPRHASTSPVSIKTGISEAAFSFRVCKIPDSLWFSATLAQHFFETKMYRRASSRVCHILDIKSVNNVLQ